MKRTNGHTDPRGDFVTLETAFYNQTRYDKRFFGYRPSKPPIARGKPNTWGAGGHWSYDSNPMKEHARRYTTFPVFTGSGSLGRSGGYLDDGASYAVTLKFSSNSKVDRKN
jgi:hypothetical protein